MYPPHHLGGYELVWQGAVRALREAGEEVRVLTSDYRSPGSAQAGGEDPDVHRDLRWYWRDHRFPRLMPWGRVALERENAATLARHLGEWRPDVVAWWSMGGMSLSLVEQVARASIPATAFVHDDWLVYGPKVDQWLRAHRGSDRSAARAERRTGVPARVDFGSVARWVFVSEATRKRALAEVVDLAATEVAPSGIDPSFVESAPEREWGSRLLHAGRLDARKGVETVLEALPLLPPETTLVLAGGGDPRYERRLRARMKELGVGERVSMLGAVPRERLIALYAEADAVVFPVVWEEPWGLVPLEAMGRGRPVVATGRGGSGEYLRDGENCVLFEAGDVGGLAEAVRRLAEDGALRARLRDGGLATAREHTAPRFEARVVEVVREVAHSASRVPANGSDEGGVP
jgi:glycosyltransferase involved in cell wall biosynthesis